VVARTDVPATPTPPEMATVDGYQRCQRRPSSKHQGLGDSGYMSCRGSLAVVHLHSGPSVLYPDCLLPSPPCGATGTGSFRREPSNSAGGTLTHERNHLHGLLRRLLTLPPEIPDGGARLCWKPAAATFAIQCAQAARQVFWLATSLRLVCDTAALRGSVETRPFRLPPW